VLSLKSPALLERLSDEWAGRGASVKFLGTDWEANTTTDGGFAPQLDVLEGAVYAVKTPSGNYAKLRSCRWTGGGFEEHHLQVLYQAEPDPV
jgi:hypothetical protein